MAGPRTGSSAYSPGQTRSLPSLPFPGRSWLVGVAPWHHTTKSLRQRGIKVRLSEWKATHGTVL